MDGVKVLLRNPRREVEVEGAMQVSTLLNRLDINRESVLVIRGDTIVAGVTPSHSWQKITRCRGVFISHNPAKWLYCQRFR